MARDKHSSSDVSAAAPRTASSPYSVESINRAADILGLFTAAHPTISLRDVARRANLPKTTAFRILSTLVSRDLCAIDPETGEYSLGFFCLRLAEIRRSQAKFHDAAMPVMREMRNEITETVVLSVRAGDHRVHVDFVDGLHPMRRIPEIGVPGPLYAGAASKVLLASMSDDEVESYFARTRLDALQEGTITNAETLRRELRLIRRRGYAESRGEVQQGGGALAAPVRDYSGETVAVVDIMTPDPRYTPAHRQRCIGVLIAGVERISERLGYRSEVRNRSTRSTG